MTIRSQEKTKQHFPVEHTSSKRSRDSKRSREHAWFRKALLLTAFGTAGLVSLGQVQAQAPQGPQAPQGQVDPRGSGAANQRPLMLPPSTQRGAASAQAPALAAASPVNAGDAKLQIYALPTEYVAYVVAQLQSQFGADKRVRITTEAQTGRLMVLAPEATQQQIAASVGAITKNLSPAVSDVSGQVLSSSVQQREYKLQRISWRELEDAILRIAGTRMSVSTSKNGELAQLQLLTDAGPREVMTIDRRTDTVRMQGSPKDVFAWSQIVSAVDFAQADSQRPTQIVPINPASPERIETALRLVRLASFQQPPQDQVTGQVPVNPDDDNAPGMAVGSPDSMGSGTGLIGDVDISFVPEMGVVIVKGGRRDVQRVLEVIEQIKKQSAETTPEIEIYPLKHVNGVALEPILRDLNDKVFTPRQGQVSLYALGQPNSLLLIGRPEALAAIKELIVKLDQPLDPNNQLRVFRLVNSSAIDAETLVRNFFAETTPGQAAAPANTSALTIGTRIKAVADYRTNSLIVQASPRDIAEVAKLILEIDVESTPAENEIRVFPIKNAVAAELQPILQSAITGTGATGAQTPGQPQQQQPQQGGSGNSRLTPPSSRLSIVPREGSAVNSGILAGVVITSNPSVNSLIVRAPSKSMPLIQALIEQLDQQPSAEASMKVYPIVNGDASTLVTILQQAFGLPVTNGSVQQGNLAGQFGLLNLPALVGGGESSLVPLRLSADTRTNTIIASGGSSDLDVIEALLYRLDEAGGNQRTTEVIWLRNANAADVNTAINSLFQGQRQLAQTLSTQGFNQQNQQVSLFERADREVLTIFVSPEASTNSIIISATPRYMKQIREVIERLDRQQPMIHVEMLIAEVTLDDQFEMGTELGLQDSLLFDRNSASGGTLGSPVFNVLNPAFNTGSPQRRPQNVAGQSSSGFAMGRTSELGYGGLVLAASSESVGLLFRMLQDANRAQILARPSLMTIDNNISVVNVGQSVPILGQSTNTVSGVTQGVDYINTGLTMQIQPRTNQDNLVNMIVAISRSSIDIANGLTINGATTPAFNQTLAQTRVTAYDGQTVILGGLISKQRISKSRRIPVLADIPLAGWLFRYDVESESRSELLVVMTPRVINFNDPNKLDTIKQVESSRMSWCLADVLNLYSDQGLSSGNGLWGPATSPVIYPDVTPAVDRENPNQNLAPQSYGQPLMDGEIIIENPSGFAPQMIIEPNGFNSGSIQPQSLMQPGTGSNAPMVNPALPIQNPSYPQPNSNSSRNTVIQRNNAQLPPSAVLK